MTSVPREFGTMTSVAQEFGTMTSVAQEIGTMTSVLGKKCSLSLSEAQTSSIV